MKKQELLELIEAGENSGVEFKPDEDIYIRIGSISRPATREQIVRLFGSGGLLHVENLPVSGTTIKNMDQVCGY